MTTFLDQDYNACLKGYFLCFLLLLGFSACQTAPIEALNDWIGWRDDNIAEETLEYLVDKQFGLDVDLSPRTPESGF